MPPSARARARPTARSLFTVALVAAVGGCCAGPPLVRGDAPAPHAAEARAGIHDATVARLAAERFDAELRWEPIWATTLGDHRFDHVLPHHRDVGVRARDHAMRDLLGRARVRSTRGPALRPSDRVTLDLLIDDLESSLGTAICEAHLWSVSPRDNPLEELATLATDHRITSAADAAHLVARFRAIPAAFGEARDDLRRGAARGLYANAESIRRTIAMLDAELARPSPGWAWLAPYAGGGPTALPAADRARFVARLTAIVEREIAPAVRAYRDFLAAEILPPGRTAGRIGVGALPMGAACYAARIRRETGLPLAAAELHARGLREIARLDRAIAELGRRTLGARGRDLATTLATLRTDRSLYFASREELLAAATAALERARRRMPDYLGVRPATPCVVAEIPAHEAPYTTIAYYREPQPGNGKPGEYVVNTYRPELRPRFEIEALTFHAGIPGHHVQIALAQEQRALPAFRRFLGSTAFVEGWGLYAEHLADELGLYGGDLDRLGMLSFDAWRAARLVVDTGIHAMGWSRARAEEFMRAHTALSDENISNEVDRYVVWPGQALAYKVGQMELERLRRLAEASLGARFDRRAFHDAILGGGAVTLGVLRGQVERWIAAGGR
jgi:uncharacterized protein (DUF885 family)